VDAFRPELEIRCGFSLQPARPYAFKRREDHYGWEKDHRGLWAYTLFVENGRVTDDEQQKQKTALLEVSRTRKAEFRFTCNQNLVLTDITSKDKAIVNGILKEHGVLDVTSKASLLRRNAIACTAFNTCPLALAEAQRYLPSLITKIEPLLGRHGVDKEELHLRMTGCPNGCGRPYLAEIGLVGTAYGRYNLHLGGDRLGLRLNKKYKESLDEAQILGELDVLLGAWSVGREEGESFGDFALRRKWV
jgi:sulfite reductase (NADPH) hemoprotein beta-component